MSAENVEPAGNPAAAAKAPSTPRKHSFSHRKSAAAKAYEPTLEHIVREEWLQFKRHAHEEPETLAIERDAIASPEELKNSIDFLLGRKPSIDFVQKTLLPLLETHPESVWHNLSLETRAKLSTAKALTRWLYLPKPHREIEAGLPAGAAAARDERTISADATWKRRHGQSAESLMPEHERKDLGSLYVAHMVWLGDVLVRRCLATHAVLMALKASSERQLVDLELPEKLKSALFISVVGYATLPTEFDFFNELGETLLQNQLAFYDAAKRAKSSKKNKDIPDADAASAVKVVRSPLHVVPFPERPLFEVFNDLAVQLEQVYICLQTRYQAYQYCCTAAPKDIKRTETESSNFSQVCRWISHKLEASPTYKVLGNEIRQKSMLFGRVLKFIGAHFDIVVAGKHGLCLEVAEVNPDFAKRGMRTPQRIDAIALRAKLDELIQFHQTKTAQLEAARARFLETLPSDVEAPVEVRPRITPAPVPSTKARAKSVPAVAAAKRAPVNAAPAVEPSSNESGQDENEEQEEEQEEQEEQEEEEEAAPMDAVGNPASEHPYVYTDEAAYSWK